MPVYFILNFTHKIQPEEEQLAQELVCLQQMLALEYLQRLEVVYQQAAVVQ